MSVEESRQQLGNAEELTGGLLYDLGFTHDSRYIYGDNAAQALSGIEDIEASLGRISHHIADARSGIAEINQGNQRIGQILRECVPAVEAAHMLDTLATSENMVNTIRDDSIETADMTTQQLRAALGRIIPVAAEMNRFREPHKPRQLFKAALGIVRTLRGQL